MVEELAKSGLYFDELSKIRILESLVSNQTNEIKESCKDFSETLVLISRHYGAAMTYMTLQQTKFIKPSMNQIFSHSLGHSSSFYYARESVITSHWAILRIQSVRCIISLLNLGVLECEVQDFEQIIESFLGILTRLGNEVEKKKLAAIGVRNSLKSITKDRERQQEKLQALISEKNTELEQLEAEYHSLQLLDVTQQETIEYLSQLQ